jgi:hypothetical protein
MNSYSIGYFVGALFNLLLWGAIFALRRDLRREMIAMSLWAAAVGLPHEYLLRNWRGTGAGRHFCGATGPHCRGAGERGDGHGRLPALLLAHRMAAAGIYPRRVDLPRLSGILLAGIPIEDLAWYAYSAALFGTYDKYAAGQRLVRRVARGDYPSGGPL